MTDASVPRGRNVTAEMKAQMAANGDEPSDDSTFGNRSERCPGFKAWYFASRRDSDSQWIRWSVPFNQAG